VGFSDMTILPPGGDVLIMLRDHPHRIKDLL
jgi:hypothetical protein